MPVPDERNYIEIHEVQVPDSVLTLSTEIWTSLKLALPQFLLQIKVTN